MDYLKEKSRDSDESQLFDDQDGNRRSPEKVIKKKDPRNFSSPNNNDDKSPLSYFYFQWMLLYWRENFKVIYNSKGFQLRSNNQLVKEETLEYFGVFAQGLQQTKHLEKLNLSGTEIHPYLMMEIAHAMTVNKSIKELNLSGSTLSSFMLSYLFKRLVSNKQLQILNLSNNQNLDIEAIQDLIQLLLHKQRQKNSLKVLDISHCNIECMALALLCSSLADTNQLTSINLSLMSFPPIALLALAKGLSKNRSIQELNISFNMIGEKGLNIFVNNLCSWGVRNIRYLNISGNNICSDKEVGRLLEKIPCCKNIDLSHNKLTSIKSIFNKRLNQHLDFILKQYTEILKLTGNLIESIPDEMFTNLTHLDLSCNQIKFKGANKIAKKLRQIPNPKWTNLCLDRNQIESEGFNDIIYSLRDNQTLKHLSIAYNQLDGESVICMIVNYDSLQLEHLDITGNQIHYSIVFVFLKLMKQCKLKKLSFCDLNNDTKGEGQHDPKFALNCESLQELDFSGNEHISCAVVSSLQTRFNNIELLNLKGCSPFHDQDLLNLSNFIRKSECLRNLNLRGLSIGALDIKSIECFAKTLKLNNKLSVINLSKNKLAQNYLTLPILLPGLGKCSNLESLDLSQNRITQKHRYCMQRMIIKSKSLKTLSLANNLISVESLISLNLDDQWDLFFKNQYVQKLRKLQTQNSSSFFVKQNFQNFTGFQNGNNNYQNFNSNNNHCIQSQNNLASNGSNIFSINNNINGNGIQNGAKYLNGGPFINGEGNNNISANSFGDNNQNNGINNQNNGINIQNNMIVDAQTVKQEETFKRQLEEEKRKFLKEYKKILKHSVNENQGNSLLRLRIKNLNLSSLKLRADDLRVIGQILSEGEAIKELNLTNNLDFGKANFVAQNLLCDDQLDSISFIHQTFRNQQTFKNLIGGKVRNLQQILLNRCIFDDPSFENFCSAISSVIPYQTLKVFHAQNLIVSIKVLPEIISILTKCKSLEILKLRKLHYENKLQQDDKFCTELQLLLSTSENLKLIDLSYNYFSKSQFESILKGFEKNKSIRNCIFERMFIPQSFFEQLFKCLAQNKTLKLIDLANNSFSESVMQELGIFVSKSVKLKFLNLSYHRNENPLAPAKKKKIAILQNNQYKSSQYKKNSEKSTHIKKYSDSDENKNDDTINNNPGMRGNQNNIEVDKQGQIQFNFSNKRNSERDQNLQINPALANQIVENMNMLDQNLNGVSKKPNIHNDLKNIKQKVYTDYFISKEAFLKFMEKSCARNSLRHLDFTACGLTEDHFAVLVKILCSQECQVKSLNIPSNHLIKNDPSHLKNLLSQNNCLQELNLKYCRLNQSAYIAICEGNLYHSISIFIIFLLFQVILVFSMIRVNQFIQIYLGLIEGKGLKCLDISENEDGDVFFEQLSKVLNKQQKIDENKLQFLFVNQMGITKKGNQQIKNIYKKLPFIFISNEWTQVDNELGQLILQQYVKIFKRYNFIPNLIPSYLKKISITESFICDSFCIDLANNFYQYEFLEQIDLSCNPKITSIGKIYLYLHLFDLRYDNSKLKTLYVQNNSKPQLLQNIVDEGILSSIAIRFSDMQRSLGFFQRIYARVLSTKYLIPKKFQLNQHLNQVLEQKTIHYHVVIILIFHMYQYISIWITLPLYLTEKAGIEDNEFTLYTVIFSLATAFLMCVIELVGVCRERLRTKLLLQSDQLYSEYWKSCINKREVLFMAIGFMERLDGLTESMLVGLYYHYDCIILMIIALAVIVLKFIKKIILFILGTYRWKKINGKEEMSKQLQNYWKFFLGQGFYITENFVNKFSPSDSITIIGTNFTLNYKTFYHGFQLVFESIPLLVLYFLYIFTVDRNQSKVSVAESVVIGAVIKQIILLIHQFFTLLLFKPSQIGQTHFDEALITLQYKKALEKFNQNEPNRKICSLFSNSTKPSNYSNLRSLMNNNRFKEEVTYKMQIKKYDSNEYNNQISYNYLCGDEHITNDTVDDDRPQQKYIEGILKKNKYTYNAGRYKQDHYSDEEGEDENERNNDDSISISTIIDENGPSVNLPNSIFNPNQPKFINNLSLLNQKHCKN